MNKVVLASKSPRRLEILEQNGYEVEVDASNIDEKVIQNGDINQMVIDIAVAKLDAVAPRHPDSLIIAADTLVYFQGKEIGQQETAQDAEKILKKLCGQTHEVVTGVCVRNTGNNKQATVGCVSHVKLRNVSAEILDEYIQSGLYRGKAGAYNIADPEFESFVQSVEGSKSNITGLPIELLPGLFEKVK